MPKQDAIHWNERYQAEEGAYHPSARSLLVENIASLPSQGIALDVAMGIGANSAVLLDHGLKVIGLDISSAAVRQAKTLHPTIQAAIIDLTTLVLPLCYFDVILNFYYLQRDLWPQYQSALKPGGYLIFETLTRDFLSVRSDIRPEFLLENGELQQAFSKWDVLIYEEGWKMGHHQHRRSIASMIARKLNQ